MGSLRESVIRTKSLEFALLECGPKRGPLALCLHGFPDSARTFRYLLPRLGEAGWRAVAPWMRGYAPTAIPADGRYQAAVLARDVIELVDALGASDAVVIGHDWGALAAHGAAILAPERVRRLVTLAVPHRGAGLALTTSYAQQKRSWYMFFFQTPLADAVVAADDFAFVERLWRDWSPGYEPRADDLDGVKRALRAPGGLAAALGYYRATFDPRLQDPALAADQMRALGAEVPVRTLYLHGARDGCMGLESLDGIESAYTGGLETRIVEDAGHFLHLERRDVVETAILDFLGRPPG
ncbi:MAG: alpha/beta hydrolase [Deltaproteobacteria bacterium]|nr:alpha/beta hydrolase [Deltaproteobacteria bacterium]